MRCNQCRPLPEEVARAADLLGRRWALAILWAAAEAGAVRFNEFKQTLEGIPPRTLAARLTELEERGSARAAGASTRARRRVEYRLTEAGRRLRTSSRRSAPGARERRRRPKRARPPGSASGPRSGCCGLAVRRFAVADVDGGGGFDLARLERLLARMRMVVLSPILSCASEIDGRDLPLPEQEDRVVVDGEGLAAGLADQEAGCSAVAAVDGEGDAVGPVAVSVPRNR